MKRKIKAAPHPTLSPVEAERAEGNENAPIGALNFFVHGVAIYATFEVLHRTNLGRGASRTGKQLTRSI